MYTIVSYLNKMLSMGAYREGGGKSPPPPPESEWSKFALLFDLDQYFNFFESPGGKSHQSRAPIIPPSF